MATGVLLLLVGEATKLSAHLTLETKRYLARVSFGERTDTLDRLGQVIEKRAMPKGSLTQPRLLDALAVELARQTQEPPAFSAIKVAGRIAHRRARLGEAVSLNPRAVSLHAATLVNFDETSATFDLLVSKGYYVRAFARDMGRFLELPAHLSSLQRLASGAFSIHEAIEWPPATPPPLLSLESVVERTLGSAALTPEGVARARCGKALEESDFVGGAPLRDPVGWVDATDGRLVAVGFRHSHNCHRVLRGFPPGAK